MTTAVFHRISKQSAKKRCFRGKPLLKTRYTSNLLGFCREMGQRVMSNEADRLSALRSYAVLDTPRMQRFDTFTRLARATYKVPIAAISLVDEHRQWFKSVEGLDFEATPRDVSFCARAIQNPREPLVVEDASLDERFVDNELVAGPPYIRFYAGVPLVDSRGFALGALCVLDTKPRTLRPAALKPLIDLAAGVMESLELHRRAADEHEHHEVHELPESDWDLMARWVSEMHPLANDRTVDAWVAHYVERNPKLVHWLRVEARSRAPELVN